MKFFSEKDYRKTQISGMLAFPLSREGWDEYLEFMREIEVDYEEQAKASLERNRENLLALLPSSLHPYIHNGTINRPYTPPDLARLIADWNQELLDRNREQGRKWREAYESIKDRLPSGAVELSERSMHDAHFVSCKRPTTDRLHLAFKESGSDEGEEGKVRLLFTGVRFADVPQNIEPADWYMQEFELTDDGFAVSILLEQTRGEVGSFVELRIEAQDLRLERF